MLIVRIEEKEGLDKEKWWFQVTVVSDSKEEDEKKVFEEGERIRNVLRKLQVLGFRVNNGLPIKADTPYYFFIVECPLRKKDMTKELIKEIAEARGELYHEH